MEILVAIAIMCQAPNVREKMQLQEECIAYYVKCINKNNFRANGPSTTLQKCVDKKLKGKK